MVPCSSSFSSSWPVVISPTPCPFPQAGALSSFLKDLLLTSLPYANLVDADFRRCFEIHFSFIDRVIPDTPGLSAEPPTSLVAGEQQR